MPGTPGHPRTCRALPCALLLLLVVAAACAGRAAAAGEVFQIRESFTHSAQQYDGYAYAFDQYQPSDTVNAYVLDAQVSGSGMTIRGYKQRPLATARMTMQILAATVNNAPIAMNGFLPPNTNVLIKATVASMSGTTTLFDIASLHLSNNVTVVVEDVSATWASAPGGAVVGGVGGSVPNRIEDRSGLFILAVKATNAANILRADFNGALRVSDNSMLTIDYSDCSGCSGPLASIGQAVEVSQSSVFRISNCNVAGAAGLLSSPQGTAVSGGSVYEVSNNKAAQSALFNYGTGAFTVESASKVSFVALTGKSSGLTSAAAVPTQTSADSSVYGGASVIGGYSVYSVAQHQAQGLSISGMVTANGYTASASGGSQGVCASYNCLSSGSSSSTALNGKCVCDCQSNYKLPTCSSIVDPVYNYGSSSGSNTCAVSNCATCDAGNMNKCIRCYSGYYLTYSQTCARITTTTTTTTTRRPTTTTTRRPTATPTRTTWYPSWTTTTTRSPSGGSCDPSKCRKCHPNPRCGCMCCRPGYVLRHGHYGNYCVACRPGFNAAQPAYTVAAAAGVALASVVAACAL